MPPIIGIKPRILILGSIPGEISLQQQMYYAHPRNAFWKILSDIYQEDFQIEYDLRKDLLYKHQIALWDIIQTCQRKGSLDASILNQSIASNPLIPFLQQYPSIKLIGLNGGKAFAQFKKVLKQPDFPQNIDFCQLPSTSPAYTLPYEKKLIAWKDFFCKMF